MLSPHMEGHGNSIPALTVHTSNQEPGALMAGNVMQTDFPREYVALRQMEAKMISLHTTPRAKASYDEIAGLTDGESKLLDMGDAKVPIHAVCETALEDIGGVGMHSEKFR